MIPKKIIIAVISAFALSSVAAAQVPVQVPEGFTIVDSLIFTRQSAVDTTLAGRNIFSVMPYCVKIYQPETVRQAVSEKIVSNDGANFNGFRIRIFFDNSQDARNASSAALYRFKTRHPGVAAYRTFDSPNFKVTVGDYRTRSEALAALKEIQSEYPSAFIVRESFKYPAFSGDADYRVDTLKILRRI